MGPYADVIHRIAVRTIEKHLDSAHSHTGARLAAAAVAAGFDFVEGGIIQDQIEPSEVRSFTFEDLYLQFAGARRAPSRLAS